METRGYFQHIRQHRSRRRVTQKKSVLMAGMYLIFGDCEQSFWDFGRGPGRLRHNLRLQITRSAQVPQLARNVSQTSTAPCQTSQLPLLLAGYRSELGVEPFH